MQPTSSEEVANVKLVEKVIEGHEPTVRNSDKKSGSGYVVKVECWVNSKALVPDDQLLYFKSQETKPEKRRELNIALDGGDAKRVRK